MRRRREYLSKSRQAVRPQERSPEVGEQAKILAFAQAVEGIGANLAPFDRGLRLGKLFLVAVDVGRRYR